MSDKDIGADVAAAPALGRMVRRRENPREDPALVSSGRGDAGGRSYGLYQFKSRRDRADRPSVVEQFIRESGYARDFQGMAVNAPGFVARFQALARTEPGFVAAQHRYAREAYFEPAMAGLRKAGLALDGRGAGVRELVFSTAVHFGPANAIRVIERALAGRASGGLSDAEVIRLVTDYKTRTVEAWFRSSPTLWKGLRNRFAAEQAEALAIDEGD